MKSFTLSFCALLFGALNSFAIQDSVFVGNFFLSTDNGSTWAPADLGFPKEEIITAWVNTSDRLIAGTSGHGIYAFDAISQRWSRSDDGLPLKARIRAIGEMNGLLIASVMHEGLYVSANEGKNWQRAKHSPSRTIRKISVVNQRIYVGTDEGIFVAESIDKPWKRELSWIPVNDIVSYGNKIFAATGQGIFRFDGKDWDKVFSGPAVSKLRITPNELAASTYDDRILVANGDGTAWATLVPFVENQYTCQIAEAHSRIIIERWMLGLSFIKVRKDVYSPESEKLPFRTLIPVKGGVMLVNTAEIGC